jgi:hypothetical protein
MQKRNLPRLTAVFNAGYGATKSGMLLPCRIVDISWGGSRIELFAKHEIITGSTVELHIEIPGLNRRIVASFRCLWNKPIDHTDNEDGHIIGGCFIGMSPEDRTLLLDRAKQQAQNDPAIPPKAYKQYAHTHTHTHTHLH